MKHLKTRFCSLLLLALIGCTEAESWHGYIYPDKQNTLVRRSAGEFRSQEDCEGACLDMLKSLNALDQGYYECGKNCEPNTSSYPMNCEESIRGNFYR